MTIFNSYFYVLQAGSNIFATPKPKMASNHPRQIEAEEFLTSRLLTAAMTFARRPRSHPTEIWSKITWRSMKIKEKLTYLTWDSVWDSACCFLVTWSHGHMFWPPVETAVCRGETSTGHRWFDKMRKAADEFEEFLLKFLADRALVSRGDPKSWWNSTALHVIGNTSTEI